MSVKIALSIILYTTSLFNPFDYQLPPDQYEYVASIVMREAGNQGVLGQVLVATCYRNAMDEVRGKRGLSECPTIHEQVASRYKYRGRGLKPTEEILERSMAIVYKWGFSITPRPLLFYYAPKYVYSSWHETQEFALEYKDHRFFYKR